MAWLKTRKGRGYLKYDNASHGAPHAMNSEQFWQLRKEFADRYGAEFTNVDGKMPDDPAAVRAEFRHNLAAVIDVLRADTELVAYLAERLVEIGDSVPESLPDLKVGTKGDPLSDPRLADYTAYPDDLYVKPGAKAANRSGLAKWAAWANGTAERELATMREAWAGG